MDERKQQIRQDLIELLDDQEVDVSQWDGTPHDFIAPESVGITVADEDHVCTGVAKSDDNKLRRDLDNMSVEEAYLIGQLMGQLRISYEHE